MMLFDLFRNYLNALVGRNQEFEKLLAAKDISAVKERMGNLYGIEIVKKINSENEYQEF